ncbi:T9SS type A sorting domain-containing protein [Flavobacterium jumunjinense]|uniref:T9SS type A sorting domain-containing protein n=1 Tax=Flavobacterium jumunjinense TaxID=998845 RepID=A0ABV5GNE8_9FLAO
MNWYFCIDVQKDVEFTVYDIVGETIISKNSSIVNNTLDLTKFEKGIYMLVVTNWNGETETYKLIKE